MRAFSLIAAFFFAAIIGGPSLAQNNPLTPAAPKPAQTEKKTSAQEFDELRHSRTAAVNEIATLSQAKQADGQNISAKEEQKKILKQNISDLGEPPPAAELWTSQIDGLKSRVDGLQVDISNAKAETPSDQTKRAKLNDDLKSIKASLSFAQDRLAHTADQIKMYNDTKEGYNNKIVQLDKEIEDTNIDIKKQDDSIESEKKILQDIEDGME